jgi:hypothetical protein
MSHRSATTPTAMHSADANSTSTSTSDAEHFAAFCCAMKRTVTGQPPLRMIMSWRSPRMGRRPQIGMGGGRRRSA